MPKHILTQYTMQTTAFKVIGRTIENDRLTLTVEVRRKTAVCPGCRGTTPSGYDRLPDFTRIRHDTWYGHAVDILVRKRRFRCPDPNCHADVFTERIDGVARPWQRHASGFAAGCLGTLATRNFKEAQEAHGVSFGVLARMLDRAVPLELSPADWSRLFPGDGPIAIGIDEHSFRKRRFVLTVTDIARGELVAVLPDATQARLEAFLGSVPSPVRARISGVAMDLTNRYASAVKKWCEGARIAVDHFHVVQLANRLLWHERSVVEGGIGGAGHPVKNFMLLLKGRERLKADERAKVAAIFADPACSRIKLAYETKEELREILRMENSKEASARFLALLRLDAWNDHRTGRSELLRYSKAFRTFVGTLQRFKSEIIAFIETRLTNAVTEGINTKIKLLKRMSYGISNLVRYMKRLILAFRPELSTHYV